MGRLESLRVVDPILTNIARGYSNNEYIGTNLLPVVQVDKEGGKIPLFGKDAFRVYDTKRAIKADSNKADIEGFDTTSYATTEYDLAIPLDYREIKESMLDIEKNAAIRATEALKLGLEKQIADLVQDANLYPSTNKETLVNNQFNDAGIDPIEIIESKKNALRGLIGKRPNVMVMGASVFDNLKSHVKLLERIKYSSLGVVTLDLMKQVFGIPNILVGESIYSEDGSTFTDIWGDNVILAYLSNPTGYGTTPYEPCFGYTLQLKGHPYVDTYEEAGGKVKVVRATDNYDVKIVGIESAYLLKDVLG
jgi:hypothetical protein